MSQNRRPPSPEEWEKHKSQIQELYHSGTLDDLAKTMAEAKLFHATPAMYKKKFRDWGWRKNLSAELALEADRKRKAREQGGRISEIQMDGRRVQAHKIDRHLKRHKGHQDAPAMNSSQGATTSRIVVQTPESANDWSGPASDRSPAREPPAAQRSTPAMVHASLLESGNRSNGSSRAPTSDTGRGYAPTGQIALQDSDIRDGIPRTPSRDPAALQMSAPEIIPASLLEPGYQSNGGSRTQTYDSVRTYTQPGQPATSQPPPSERREPQRNDMSENQFLYLLNFSQDLVSHPWMDLSTPNYTAPSAERSASVSHNGSIRGLSMPPQTLPKMRQAIHQAAQNGHTNSVRLLLRSAPNTYDVLGPADETPLTLAAQGGHYEIVEELLRHGANANHASQSNRRPIHQAAQGGYIDCVRRLISVGAMVDEADANGVTPFMLACFGGHNDIAKLLLSEKPGIDVNRIAEKSKARPIQAAAQAGHAHTIQFLLEAGAFVDGAGEHGDTTALWIACQEGHTEVARVLLSHGANTNPCSPNQRRPIHQAAQNGHVDIVRLLDEYKADMDCGEEEGVTPLWLACQGGHTGIVELLLDKGANPDAKAVKSSRSPLHQAAQGGHYGAVVALIRHEADVNIAEEDGWPPLLLAAQQGHLNIVELLIESDAKVDLRAADGITALWLASQQGHTDIAKLLLMHNADPEVSSSSGRRPIHQAAQNGHLEVVTLLADHEVDIACVSYSDDGNFNALWLASQSGHDDIVEFLIEKGVSAVIG